MEKNNPSLQPPSCKAYACFQQPETLKILNFLQASQGKVTYKGLTEQQGRRHKDFPFQSVSFLSQKLRHTHNPIIQSTVKQLLLGKSSTLLILGNDQSKKQKILIGQSQNQGILLNSLATLFQTCYEQELQDRVTIKLSCWEHRQGKIGDLLGGTGGHSHLSNWISHDLIEGNLLVGIPQIIIRNMKSALKIIRIFMKSLQLNRQHGQQTQNVVFTIKLQIDNSLDKQGKTTQFLLSKFHIVKLALPHLRTQNKHAPWFITLFNYMQAQVLEKIGRNEETVMEDQFSCYLRDTLIRDVSTVHCLTVFTNKMNANDCLTALKFSSYLQQLKLDSHICTLNIPQLIQQKNQLQTQLVRSYIQQRTWTKTVCTWLPTEQYANYLDLQLISSTHHHLMQACNLLQYEYANLLTMGCDRLEKYIFNQEVQDYFYAKKVVLEPSQELQSALTRYLQMRKQIQQFHSKFIKKINGIIGRIKKESIDTKEQKYLLISKTKAKQHLQKLFELYSTLSTHFLYQNQQIFSKMQPQPLPPIQEEPLNPLSVNIEQIIQKVELKETVEPAQVAVKQLKRKKIIDQTEMMFTNSNAFHCTHRHRN